MGEEKYLLYNNKIFGPIFLFVFIFSVLHTPDGAY